MLHVLELTPPLHAIRRELNRLARRATLVELQQRLAALDLCVVHTFCFHKLPKVCFDLFSRLVLETNERQPGEREALEVLEEKLAQRGAATQVKHNDPIDAANR